MSDGDRRINPRIVREEEVANFGTKKERTFYVSFPGKEIRVKFVVRPELDRPIGTTGSNPNEQKFFVPNTSDQTCKEALGQFILKCKSQQITITSI